MNTSIGRIVLCTFIVISSCWARKHELVLENDVRKYFSITTFGFFSGGQLEINLNYLTFLSKHTGFFGLTLTKTVSDSITPYMESHQNECLLVPAVSEDENVEILSFLLNPNSNEVIVNCSKLSTALEIQPVLNFNNNSAEDTKKSNNNAAKFQNPAQQIVKQKRSVNDGDPGEEEETVLSSKSTASTELLPHTLSTKSSEVLESALSAEKAGVTTTKDKTKSDKDSVSNEKTVVTSPSEPKICTSSKLSFKNDVVEKKREISDLKFIILIKEPTAEGLYSVFFHNCGGLKDSSVPVNLSISITEKNGESYLSAGEIPLPRLYFLMSFVFFITGCVWISVLRRKREEAFKIHYLMGLLVFVKSLSLLFHGINFHIIAKDGYPMEAWAVLYYITHLLKGALLFITIVLIGTGWAFIKHILSDKDKKIFMIVIPLQVLANVAKIIMEESEEGNSQHYTWKEVFILVDLVCCGAILFPVVWSIRHLQEASHTDGKAAINLEKLKLFRHFYIMIVCYIYFTRIIVYLLQITVPFQYEWLDEMFRETATLTFFVLTGYNFRPTTSNPYFRLSQDDDLEMDEVITQTGFTEAATKTVRSREASRNADDSTTTKRESSHEYD